MGKEFRVHSSLFLVALIYGATFSIAKDVMPKYIGAFGLITIRVAGAAILLSINQFLFFKEKVNWKVDGLKIFSCALFGVAANMLFFFKGLSLTSPINGSVIMVTTPLFVGFLSFWFLKEKVTLRKILGLFLGLSGGIMLILSKNISSEGASSLGDLFIMINAMFYAYYLILIKPLTLKYKPITIIKWTFVIGFFLVLPFGFEELTRVQWSLLPNRIYFSIGFLIFCSTFLTYVLNGWALKFVNSSMVGAYVYLQPILATLISIFLGKDFLTKEKIFYSIIIFSGVYLVSFPKSIFPNYHQIKKKFTKTKA